MSKAYIDYGHYNNDSGAVGNGLREVDLNASYGKFLANYLSANGVTVKIGKGGSLSARYNEANAWGCDVFISCHINAGGADGFEVFHYPGSVKGKAIAQKVYDQVVAIDKLNNGRGVKSANFAVLRGSNAPAILTEAAFIDTKDIQCIDERHEQEKFGISIAKGVLKYLGIDNVTPPVQKPVTPSPKPPVVEKDDYISIAKKYIGSESKVKKIQLILNCFGYKLTVDGDCGNATATAIGDFQAKHGLAKDYMFGTKCFKVAYDIISCRTISRGNAGNEVKFVQYVVGATVDGSFGKDTGSKVIAYQKKNKLSADGVVGKNTLYKMIIG